MLPHLNLDHFVTEGCNMLKPHLDIVLQRLHIFPRVSF